MRILTHPLRPLSAPCTHRTPLSALSSIHLCSSRIKALRRRLPFLLIALLVFCVFLFPASREHNQHSHSYQVALALPVSEMMAPRNADTVVIASDSLAEPTPTSPIIRSPSLPLPLPIDADLNDADDELSSRPSTPSLFSDEGEQDSHDTLFSSDDESEIFTPDKERERPELMLLPQLRRVPKFDDLRMEARRRRRSVIPPQMRADVPGAISPEQDDALFSKLDETLRSPDCPLSPILASSTSAFSTFSTLLDPTASLTPRSPEDLPVTPEISQFSAFPDNADEGLVYIQLPCHIHISGSMSTDASGPAEDKAIITTGYADDYDDVELVSQLQEEESGSWVNPSFGGLSTWAVVLLLLGMMMMIACVPLPSVQQEL